MQSGIEAEKDHVFTRYPEVQEVYDKIRSLEPDITKQINTVAENTDGLLVDLEHSVKTASFLEEKLERTEITMETQGESFDPTIAIKEFSDILRYTDVLPSDMFTSTIPSLLSEFEKAGFFVVEIDNKFVSPVEDTHYKGLHIGLVSPQGKQVEFQVHTRESFEAKIEGHKDYEISRDETGKYSQEEKEEANERMIERYDAIPDVPNIDQIESYKESKETIMDLCEKRELFAEILEEDPYELEDNYDQDNVEREIDDIDNGNYWNDWEYDYDPVA